MEKIEVWKNVPKNINRAIEVELDNGRGKFTLGYPDERGLRFYIKKGIRGRGTRGFCLIEKDIVLGETLDLLISTTNRYTPNRRESYLGVVRWVYFLKTTAKEFREFAVAHTERGGAGSLREIINAGGARHPELFEEYRRIFLDSHASIIQQWFNNLSHIGDELMRTVCALLDYFAPDGTDYIEGKFSYVLKCLGYEMIPSFGDEDYKHIIPIYPVGMIKISDKEVKLNGEMIGKSRLRKFFVYPLLEALKVSKSHQWDEAAWYLVEVVRIILEDDLELRYQHYCYEIEKKLWQAAFLLGYRFIKAEEKNK